jgi:hypothetical protein
LRERAPRTVEDLGSTGVEMLLGHLRHGSALYETVRTFYYPGRAA